MAYHEKVAGGICEKISEVVDSAREHGYGSKSRHVTFLAHRTGGASVELGLMELM